jgi:hypothetical protein
MLWDVEVVLKQGLAPVVLVGFSGCRSLQPNAVILLGGMARAVHMRGGSVRFLWKTLDAKVRENLRKNGFLAVFGAELASKGNAIPYREHWNPKKDEVMTYLRTEWLGRGWVSLSAQLRDAVVGSLWEIYANRANIPPPPSESSVAASTIRESNA